MCFNIIMQKFLALFFCLAFSVTSAQAGFFDDLFGNDDKVELKSYSIDLRDVDGAETIVSHNEKVLKLRIFYPKTDATKIDELTNQQLRAAVQDALVVSSVDTETDAETDLGDLKFVIRFKQVSSKDDNFYEMQFLSQGLTLDTPQRLDFSFNAKQFTRLLNLGTDPDEDRYTDQLYVKPIVIGLKDASIELIGFVTSLHSGYNFQASFDDDKDDFINTDIAIDDIAFTYKTNGISKTATAKASTKSKPISLSVSADSVTGIITAYDNEICDINLPISIEPVVEFKAGRSYNLRIPLQIETRTESGLKVLLRGIAKGQLDTAPAQ